MSSEVSKPWCVSPANLFPRNPWAREIPARGRQVFGFSRAIATNNRVGAQYRYAPNAQAKPVQRLANSLQMPLML